MLASRRPVLPCMAKETLGILDAAAPFLFTIDSLLHDFDIVILGWSKLVEVYFHGTVFTLILATRSFVTFTTAVCNTSHLPFWSSIIPRLLSPTIIKRARKHQLLCPDMVLRLTQRIINEVSLNLPRRLLCEFFFFYLVIHNSWILKEHVGVLLK